MQSAWHVHAIHPLNCDCFVYLPFLHFLCGCGCVSLHSQVMAALMKRAVSIMPKLNHSNISDLAWALSTLGYTDAQMFATLAGRAVACSGAHLALSFYVLFSSD